MINRDQVSQSTHSLTARGSDRGLPFHTRATTRAMFNAAFFYDCSYSISFLKYFESYHLSLTKQVHLNLKDMLLGLLTPALPLLNYLLLIGKIYLWVCGMNKELPIIRGFQSKVKLKYETEKYICTKNNYLDMFRKKWAI